MIRLLILKLIQSTCHYFPKQELVMHAQALFSFELEKKKIIFSLSEVTMLQVSSHLILITHFFIALFSKSSRESEFIC